MGDVEIGSCFGQSDHEMVEISIFGKVRRGASKTITLGFQRTVVGRVPWDSVLKGKRVQESWLFLKKEVKGVGAGLLCHKMSW